MYNFRTAVLEPSLETIAILAREDLTGPQKHELGYPKFKQALEGADDALQLVPAIGQWTHALADSPDVDKWQEEYLYRPGFELCYQFAITLDEGVEALPPFAARVVKPAKQLIAELAANESLSGEEKLEALAAHVRDAFDGLVSVGIDLLPLPLQLLAHALNTVLSGVKETFYRFLAELLYQLWKLVHQKPALGEQVGWALAFAA